MGSGVGGTFGAIGGFVAGAATGPAGVVLGPVGGIAGGIGGSEYGGEVGARRAGALEDRVGALLDGDFGEAFHQDLAPQSDDPFIDLLF